MPVVSMLLFLCPIKTSGLHWQSGGGSAPKTRRRKLPLGAPAELEPSPPECVMHLLTPASYQGLYLLIEGYSFSGLSVVSMWTDRL